MLLKILLDISIFSIHFNYFQLFKFGGGGDFSLGPKQSVRPF